MKMIFYPVFSSTLDHFAAFGSSMRLGFSEPVPGLDSQEDKACAGCLFCVCGPVAVGLNFWTRGSRNVK